MATNAAAQTMPLLDQFFHNGKMIRQDSQKEYALDMLNTLLAVLDEADANKTPIDPATPEKSLMHVIGDCDQKISLQLDEI
jgi:predicted component of type VI protein secretion system